MKITAIIQARMGSTRLPGKVLKEINGKPLIEHLIKRISQVQEICNIYVATSKNEENKVLIDFLKSQPVQVFVGDEENVLSRFIEIIKQENSDIIVRITADNPLTDDRMLEILLNNHIENQADYSFMTGLPIGVSAEVVNAKCLLELEEKRLEQEDFEHVTIYLKKHPEVYKINYVQASTEVAYPELVLTVDTEKEMQKMNEIFHQFGDNVTLTEAIKYLKHEY